MGQESYLPGNDAKAHTPRTRRMSAGLGRESLRLSAARGCPVLPVLAGHFSRLPRKQRAWSYEQSALSPICP